MLSTVLAVGLVNGQDMVEDGGVPMDGPTDTHLIGDGVATPGEALALALGAHITKVNRQHRIYSYAPSINAHYSLEWQHPRNIILLRSRL